MTQRGGGDIDGEKSHQDRIRNTRAAFLINLMNEENTSANNLKPAI